MSMTPASLASCRAHSGFSRRIRMDAPSSDSFDTVYSDAELLPLSGLQHLAFCERQWALIHIEQQWEENRLTAEGRGLHAKVDEGPDEQRAGVRIVRGLALHSLRLGISGKADVFEFRLNCGL